MYSFLGGTPGACLMFIRPGVQVKPIESHTSETNRNRNEIRTYIALEDRRADSEIGCCLRRAEQPGEKDREHFAMP